MSRRDAIRSATLGRQTQFRRKLITYYPPKYEKIIDDKGQEIGLEHVGFEEEGIEVEVRQPTIKERNKLLAECRGDDGTLDEMEFILQCAIRFVYDPESGEAVYEEGDYDALVSQPAGDFVDQFGGEAIELLTLGAPEKKSGNSKQTKAGKRSTQSRKQ